MSVIVLLTAIVCLGPAGFVRPVSRSTLIEKLEVAPPDVNPTDMGKG
jgi:hypothetical protein